ncbi:coproporphyrinogen III oxidase [Actinoplanes lobatus]|uniref:Heme chaperone HemW n=1 Tax=Actinoplanes lobatus TaxID=113568 RepID=A0A7W7HPC3_9ACTN|nr:STM4012 family radical SAM protein [Actinoplanes lobatus]MBB4754224.1 oxygen-independent coproporphyrinogen-3 oxidase [Actinoplanes lobatus]GGN61951.1 coproporphyrinogen III oxidase [Actinoplanes lobatus]GIE44899.1 coproporphyrinogen III oxidase [Actinoplanes lobatus]
MNLDDSPYQGYLYAYPHKTAYRKLDPRPPLSDVWAGERQDSLFGYVHLPFCEMRCGFCNLFTRANPPDEQVTAYLAQLRRQAAAVRDSLSPGAVFSRLAIGGGTPTYLTAPELSELFGIVGDAFGTTAVPLSVETSPATATPDRLAVLAEHGTTRISIGVQSFLDTEARAAGRPQRLAEVMTALTAIREARIPVLNIDLIYGIDGQTTATWQHSLDEALRWRPEELYLYPLYVRPLTGLGRRAHARADWDRQRQQLYRQAVGVLTDAGYVRHSMRQFRLAGAPVPDGPDYCCQDDGTIGLGCGARSYTTDLHYSFDYAVAVSEVRAVIDDYLSRPQTDFRYAEIGFRLDAVEQRRRWLLKSLLRAEGVDAAAYLSRFGTAHTGDFPQLDGLVDRGWLNPARTRLTDEGLAWSDAIGPWLVSAGVREAMGTYVPR